MIAWIVEALIASALLMAIVLMVRAPVRRVFGPQIAYALWALPALRLMLPPLPAEWRSHVAMPISRASEAVSVLVLPVSEVAPVAAAVNAPEAAALAWAPILWGGWALGAAAFFLLHLMRHRRFCRRLLGDARMVDEVDGVRVIESAGASGPLAFGVGRRFVAFPRDFAERYDADERELALAHELGHHQRGDLAANWVALGVLAMHWFNPLAWRAFRAFRCDQELANDALVLAGRSRADRHIYACAIVKAAHGGAISAACHLHTISDLKGRLKMLSNTRLSRTRLMTGAAAVVGVVATGLFVTASGTQAAAAVTRRIEAATGVMLNAAPQAPAIAAPATVPTPPPVPAVTKGRTHVVIVKDGKRTEYEGKAAEDYLAKHPAPIPPAPPAVAVTPAVPAVPTMPALAHLANPPMPPMPAMPPMPNIPQVVERNCGPSVGGLRREMVIQSSKGGKRTMVICTNRIEAAAAEGARVAVKSKAIRAQALASALASLDTARASIRAQRDMSAEQRREALAGLDEAMVEMRSEMASDQE